MNNNVVRYRIWNKNKYDVGIRLLNNIEINIKPNSFYSVDEDNLIFLNSVCNLFKDFTLNIEDKEAREILGIEKQSLDTFDDEIILQCLNESFDEMKAKFSSIDNTNIKYKIFDIARSISDDLSGRKLKYLAELCGKEVEDFLSNTEKKRINLIKVKSNEADEKKDGADTKIEEILKSNFMKMKVDIAQYSRKKDKELIFQIATKIKDDLSHGKIKFLSGFCGKTIVE